MRKICISLSKGGVAKSTSAVTIAHGLALENKKVLLIDTDEQSHDNALLGISPKLGLADVLNEQATIDEALFEARDNLYILAGGLDLAGAKRTIAKKEFGGERVLSKILESLNSEFDYVIVDTSPAWDSLTINSLFYCNEVIIPVSLDVLSLNSLIEFKQRLDEVKNYKGQSFVEHILPTFADGRVKKTSEIIAILEKHYKDILLSPIRYSARIAEAPSFDQTIFEYAPKSHVAKDYNIIIKRILNEKTST